MGWITLRFTINTRSAYHDFGVVQNLPIDMLTAGEFLRQHECQFMYKASGLDAFGIKDGSCDVCLRNKEKMKAEHDPQLQPTPKRTPRSVVISPALWFQHAYLMSKSEGARS